MRFYGSVGTDFDCVPAVWLIAAASRGVCVAFENVRDGEGLCRGFRPHSVRSQHWATRAKLLFAGQKLSSAFCLAQLQIHTTGCRNGVNWPHREWESFYPPQKCWTFKALVIYILQVGGSSGGRGVISSGYKRFKHFVEKAATNHFNMSDVCWGAGAAVLAPNLYTWTV